VPSYPTGRRAPFVAALDEGAKTRGDGDSVAVDLSADYYFDESGWCAYGLPGENFMWIPSESQPLMYIELCTELYGRDTPRTAKRISNPGCYATAVQLLFAPLLPPSRRAVCRPSSACPAAPTRAR
jgi:N-acetyl-gamma-glutamyl-phosphate reductase/acetylglutamate kinase